MGHQQQEQEEHEEQGPRQAWSVLARDDGSFLCVRVVVVLGDWWRWGWMGWLWRISCGKCSEC